MGECLELSPNKLYIGYETKEKKQQNNGLMSAFYEEA
jgi:hypothetical protein